MTDIQYLCIIHTMTTNAESLKTHKEGLRFRITKKGMALAVAGIGVVNIIAAGADIAYQESAIDHQVDAAYAPIATQEIASARRELASLNNDVVSAIRNSQPLPNLTTEAKKTLHDAVVLIDQDDSRAQLHKTLKNNSPIRNLWHILGIGGGFVLGVAGINFSVESSRRPF